MIWLLLGVWLAVSVVTGIVFLWLRAKGWINWEIH